jgi:hypothetical protein
MTALCKSIRYSARKLVFAATLAAIPLPGLAQPVDESIHKGIPPGSNLGQVFEAIAADGWAPTSSELFAGQATTLGHRWYESRGVINALCSPRADGFDCVSRHVKGGTALVIRALTTEITGPEPLLVDTWTEQLPSILFEIRLGTPLNVVLTDLREKGWRPDPHGGPGPRPFPAPAETRWLEAIGVPFAYCHAGTCKITMLRNDEVLTVRGEKRDLTLLVTGREIASATQPRLEDRLRPGISLRASVQIARAAGYRFEPDRARSHHARGAQFWFRRLGLQTALCTQDRTVCTVKLSSRRRGKDADDILVLTVTKPGRKQGEPRLVRIWRDQWYE